MKGWTTYDWRDFYGLCSEEIRERVAKFNTMIRPIMMTAWEAIEEDQGGVLRRR